MIISNQRIIITPGEPAGIGPDLAIIIAQQIWPIELVICVDPNLLITRANQMGLPIILRPYQPNSPAAPQPAGTLTVLAINVNDKVTAGTLNIANSNYVLKTLARACNGCLHGEFSALVTGPVHKGIINDSGVSFIGHTEYLTKYSKCKRAVMMLVSNTLRIALATTHIPLISVAKTINNQLLYETILILIKGLQKYFNIARPKIYICGLNPHAGENGHVGKEEIQIITPTLNILRRKGYDLIGPLPADTLFQSKYLEHADAILAMYHDQGLPIIKHQDFGRSVNITLGLPFIRTSVDHGTALELAGSKLINANSIITALNLTIKIIQNFNAQSILS